jgi:arylsulfatase A-like enzyme
MAGVIALALGLREPLAPAPPPTPAPGGPDPGAPTLVFVVLDNVRADRLALCGHERPTSARLESLVRKGAQYTCRAYAPGSWTLPSHASFFTGVDVPTHGAHSLPAGGEALGRSTSESVRALDEQLPTLAEQLAARGYQTVLVSGNPVVSPESGLTRGFERVEVADGFNKLHGRALERAVKGALAAADPSRPLFLFVNIADAHQPWRRVPARVKWLPKRPAFRLHASKPDGFWQGWYRGDLATAEKVETLGHLQDVYDYGIYRADRTLGRVLGRVRKSGWSKPGMRYVVTSDHGEFLGEHGLLDHGHYLEDENQRVLLMVGGDDAPELPDTPVSATQAFHLVRDGALADDSVPVVAATFPHRQREVWSGGAAYGRTSAAQWSEQGRLLW